MTMVKSPQTIAPELQALIDEYKPALEQAVEALNQRAFYEYFPENPKAYAEDGDQKGQAAYKQQLGSSFDRLQQTADTSITSDEISPYTQEKLGITYPACSTTEGYIQSSRQAFDAWRQSELNGRCAVLLKALDNLRDNFFELCYATMHTTGQGYMMAFQASGPHGSDRAVEAIATSYQEQNRYPGHVLWEKPSKKRPQKLEKYYTNVPLGIDLTICCSTFPVWNAMPGIFASLATGNTVIVKPHPRTIYPLALIVAIVQDTLKAYGFDPNTIMLAPDLVEHQITKELAEHPEVKMIDFTGSSEFGDYVESLPGKVTFTEKAGVNSVIIDSTNNLKGLAQNLATSISLYSGQMCTAPQNIFIPKDGIDTEEGHKSYEEVANAIGQAIQGLCSHEKAGPAVCGAIQSQATKDRIEEAKQLGARVLQDAFQVQNPDFPQARTSSPVLIEVPANQYEHFARELFGPIAIAIPTDSTDHSIELAQKLAREHGAITCSAYAKAEATQEKIADGMAESHTAVAFNLTDQVFVNQNAAFSDLHVSGNNPAGNASLTDPEFVQKRFSILGMKVNVE
jgi:phenylacetic acid degradation protein paaN